MLYLLTFTYLLYKSWFAVYSGWARARQASGARRAAACRGTTGMPFDEDAGVERTKRKDAASSLRERAPRRLLLLLLLLVLIGSRTMQALLSETVLLSISGGVGGGEGARDGDGDGGGASGGGGDGGGGTADARRQAGSTHGSGTTEGVFAALELLRRSRRKYVIVDAKHGLGNRLRALASAMSVAAAVHA